MTTAPKRTFRPLSSQVVGRVLLLSVLFTLVMTAGLIGTRYMDERDQAQAQLRFAADSYEKSLANSLWDLDMAGARLQLEALSHFSMVGHVVLTTTIGQHLHVYKNNIDQADFSPRGMAFFEKSLTRPDHPETEVGKLRLYVDQDALLHHVQRDALRILTAEALKGMALGLLIAWIIGRMVTRHVSRIAQHVASLRPDALDQPPVRLELDRRHTASEDELDKLCDAFNRLNYGLSDYLRRQQMLEAEVRAHRDGLADMVAERTRSLERLKGFHSLIIAILTRFIDLPLKQENAAVDEGLAIFGKYFGAERCLLLVHDIVTPQFHITNSWPPLANSDAAAVRGLPEHVFPSELLAASGPEVCCRMPQVGLSGTAPDSLTAFFGTSCYALARVKMHDRTIGLLCLVGLATEISEEDVSLLELAARVAGNMIDHKNRQMHLFETQQTLEQVIQELHALSRHDALTGLANRRHFDEIKEVEFRRARRASQPLSVLMCDIDQFKAYNDTYGHGQGDLCLKTIGNCLTQLFARAGEFPARLGGEEFAVLLPNVSPKAALLLAENLRQAIWECNLPHSSSPTADRVTISIGVAYLRPDRHQGFGDLLQDADKALYRAKATNRNRVCLAE